MSVLIPDPTYPGTQSFKELRLLRKQTAQFIAANQLDLVLLRPVWAVDGAGGQVQTGEDILVAQAMRLIHQAAGRQSLEDRTLDGATVTPTYVLQGKFSANMNTGDYFLIDTVRYDIVFVREDRRYQTIGEVVRRG